MAKNIYSIQCVLLKSKRVSFVGAKVYMTGALVNEYKLRFQIHFGWLFFKCVYVNWTIDSIWISRPSKVVQTAILH